MAVLAAVAGDREQARRLRMSEEPAEYLIELDVSGLADDELAFEMLGHRLTVIGDQDARRHLDGGPQVALRLEESFRLPTTRTSIASRRSTRAGRSRSTFADGPSGVVVWPSSGSTSPPQPRRRAERRGGSQ